MNEEKRIIARKRLELYRYLKELQNVSLTKYDSADDIIRAARALVEGV